MKTFVVSESQKKNEMYEIPSSVEDIDSADGSNVRMQKKMAPLAADNDYIDQSLPSQSKGAL